MTELTEGSRSRDALGTETGRRKPRLRILLMVGIVAVVAAVAIRFSPWAREYQLRRTSLAALRLEAVELPKDPLVLYHLGTKAYNAKSLGEAGYCFDRAVALDPKMVRAHVGLALVQRDIGQWPQAYASAKQAQQLAPRDVDVQFLVAMLVMHTSKTQAVAEFRKVLSLAPRRADASYWLGICLWEVNQLGEALPALKKAVSLEPKHPLYQRDLGEVLLKTNHFAEALTTLESARKLNDEDPRVPFLLGSARLKLAKTESDVRSADELLGEAETLLGKPTAETLPQFTELADARVDAAMRLNEPKQALTYVTEARRQDPRALKLLYRHAEVLRKLGRSDEARPLMEAYEARSSLSNEIFQMTERIKQDPKNPALRLRIARLFARFPDVPRAINQYEYCLYLDADHAAAKRELAELRRRTAGSAGLKGGREGGRPPVR